MNAPKAFEFADEVAIVTGAGSRMAGILRRLEGPERYQLNYYR